MQVIGGEKCTQSHFDKLKMQSAFLDAAMEIEQDLQETEIGEQNTDTGQAAVSNDTASPADSEAPGMGAVEATPAAGERTNRIESAEELEENPDEARKGWRSEQEVAGEILSDVEGGRPVVNGQESEETTGDQQVEGREDCGTELQSTPGYCETPPPDASEKTRDASGSERPGNQLVQELQVKKVAEQDDTLAAHEFTALRSEKPDAQTLRDGETDLESVVGQCETEQTQSERQVGPSVIDRTHINENGPMEVESPAADNETPAMPDLGQTASEDPKGDRLGVDWATIGVTESAEDDESRMRDVQFLLRMFCVSPANLELAEQTQRWEQSAGLHPEHQGDPAVHWDTQYYLHNGDQPPVLQPKKFLFRCKYCGLRFTDTETYTRHLNIHLGAKKRRMKAVAIKAKTPPQSSGELVLTLKKCKVCGKVFKNYLSLGGHMRGHKLRGEWQGDITKHALLHTPVKTSANGTSVKEEDDIVNVESLESFTKSSVTDVPVDLDASELGEFECNLCDKVFKTQRSLWGHQSAHTGKSVESGEVHCQVCGKTFKDQKALWGHEGFHKRSNKTAAGDVGSGGVSDADSALSAELKCEICGKIFKDRYALGGHQTAHRLEKKLTEPTVTETAPNVITHPYECETCGKRFKSKLGMTGHQWKHKRLESSGELECGICGKKFKDQFSLWGHQAAHKRAGATPVGKDLSGEIPQDQSWTPAQITTPKTSKTYDCQICGLHFENSHVYGGHLSRHRAERKRKLEESPFGDDLLDQPAWDAENPGEDPGQETGQAEQGPGEGHDALQTSGATPAKQFVCNKCGKVFESGSKLGGHRRACLHFGESPSTSITESTPEPSEPVTSADFTALVDLNVDKKLHTCDECGETFSTGNGLGGHKNKHKAERRRRLLKALEAPAAPQDDPPDPQPHSAADVTQDADQTETHEPPKLHNCDVCGRAFSSLSALGGHKSKHFWEKRRLEIENLEVQAAPADLETPEANTESMETKTSQGVTSPGHRDYVCNKCGKVFDTGPKLGGHRRKCLHFPESSGLRTPEATPAPGEPISFSALDQNVDQTDTDSAKPHKCDVCGETFSSPHALGGHKGKHNSEKLRVAREAPQGQLDPTGKVHECDECGQRFSTGNGLGGHKNKHKAERRRRLMQETMQVELGQLEFLPVDPKFIKTEPVENLEHLGQVSKPESEVEHNLGQLGFVEPPKTPVKRYECDVCGKIFTDGRAFGGHQGKHRAEKKRLSAESLEQEKLEPSLGPAEPVVIEPEPGQHVETVHDVEQGNLERHLDQTQSEHQMVHDDAEVEIVTPTKLYKCDLCGKTFGSGRAFGGHKNAHKGERNVLAAAQSHSELETIPATATPKHKPYDCEFCGKQFTSPQGYGGHMYKHREERRRRSLGLGAVTEVAESKDMVELHCEKCGEAFGNAEALTRHTQTDCARRGQPQPEHEMNQVAPDQDDKGQREEGQNIGDLPAPTLEDETQSVRNARPEGVRV